MTVVPFTRTKGSRDFEGMGIKISAEQLRADFDMAFALAQAALPWLSREAARMFNDEGILDEISSQWADTVEHLEAAVAIMKAALARLEHARTRGKDYDNQTETQSAGCTQERRARGARRYP